MRDALTRTLDRISGAAAPGELGLTATLGPKDEAAAWDLAIKLARELATEIDPGGLRDPAAAAPGGGPTRGRRVDYG